MLNLYIFHLLNNLAGSNVTLDKFFIFGSGDLGFVILFLVIVFFYKDVHKNAKSIFENFKLKTKELFLIFTAVIGSWVITQVIKNITHIPRPFEVIQNMNVLIIHGGFDSFPSGHATFYAALAMAVYIYHKNFGRVLFIGAFIIGICRIIAGVHYPVDILVGWVIGILFAYYIHNFAKKVFDKYIKMV